MTRRCLGLLILALAGMLPVGCGNQTVTMGSVSHTAIGPSHTIPYPVGPGGGQPPSVKDIMKMAPKPDGKNP